MKKTILISVVLTSLMLLTLVTGCNTGTSVQTTESTAKMETPVTAPDAAEDTSEAAVTAAAAVTVADMNGREIKLDAPADKIVALTASDCEILYAIGAGNTLIGRGEYCDYPTEVSLVPSVQSGSEMNIEQIIALAPQVVILSEMAQTKEQVAALETAGIAVVVNDADDIEGVYRSIGLIGEITGRNDEAADVVSQMKTSFEMISVNASGNGEKTVYFEVSPLEYGLWTAGNGTFMNELAGMLGLTNAFADVEGWAEISQEQVIERDPDFIVSISMYYGEGLTPVDEILGREGWQDMKAIRNCTILNADSNEISRPGPRLTIAAATLYSFIYESDTAAAAD